MSLKPRRAYETGHRPKFLVVVDETPEADRALYFAARGSGHLSPTPTTTTPTHLG